MSNGKSLTDKQAEIVEIIVALSSELGRGVGYREILSELARRECVAEGIEISEENMNSRLKEINTITGHLKGIREKTGMTQITWESTPTGIKPNSLRGVGTIVGASPVSQVRKPETSGFGENFAFVIMGEKVAFMFFNDSAKMSDVVDLAAAIKTADGLNIPAGTTVERLTAVAAKLAPRKLRPPTPAVVAPPAEPVKKRRTKKA